MPVLHELAMSLAQQQAQARRSLRLNQLTHGPYAQLSGLVDRHAPFSSTEHFSRLVAAQYLLQRDLEPVYQSTQLIRLLPDLPQRCRLEQAALDLRDLRQPLPQADDSIRLRQMDTGEALAWLFVSEAAKRKAATWLQRAPELGLNERFGARHLVEPDGGCAQSWQRFISALDAAPLDPEQERRVDVAALAACARITEHLNRCFA